MSLPENPITREEQYLSKIAGQGFPIPDYPITREEQYLDYIAKHGGGGGGGTSDYNDLDNKPKVNNVELSGNKTLDDLSIQHKLTAGSNITIENNVISSTGGSAELTDDLTTAIEVGGIEAGTEYEAGTSLETIVRDLLEPTLYPTIVEPSVTISVPQTLFEKGTRTYVHPTGTISRGSITPAYGTSGYRAGTTDATTIEDCGWYYYFNNMWFEYYNSHEDGFDTNESQSKWRVVAYFNDGEQPKDSKGNNYQTPYSNPDGEYSNTITFTFVNAMWANTASIGTVAKLSLINNNTTKQRDMVFPAQTVANPEVFDIPASWNVTAVQVKNDLNNQFEDASSQFSVTDVTHDDAGGTSTAYKRYAFNMGIATGSRTVRVKWS